MEKMERALVALFVKAQLELMKLEQEEDGMQTVEAVILVAVAVVLAGAVINLLTGDKETGKGGIIDKIFQGLITKMNTIFGTSISTT